MAAEMLCAVWQGRNDVRLERRPIPTPGPTDVLVRVAACGLCATDIHAIDGSIPLFRPPRILGHEVGGVIEAVGEQVADMRPGTAVTLDTSMPCDVCYFCRDARPFLCPNRVSTFAGLAEFTAAPRRLVYALPPGVEPRVGALAEPISCVLHAIDMGAVRAGARVAVVGAGPIGLLLTQVLSRSGVVMLLVSDPDPARRDLARRMGATHVVDPLAEDLGQVARDLTDGVGIDVAFEAVGAAATVEAAIALPRKGGTVVLVGVAPGDAVVSLRPYDLFERELTIRASAMRSFEMTRAVALLATLDLDPFLEGQMPLDRIDEAIAMARSRGAPKVLVLP